MSIDTYYLNNITDKEEVEVFQVLTMLECLNLRYIHCWDNDDRRNYRFNEQAILTNDQDQVLSPNPRLISKFHSILYRRCLDNIESACYRTRMYGRKWLVHHLFRMKQLIKPEDVANIELKVWF